MHLLYQGADSGARARRYGSSGRISSPDVETRTT